MKQLLTNYKYQILLAIMWLVAFVVVWPVGEFAINDDWSFAKNVYHLTVQHEFVIDTWPSMNLISQTLFGTAITSVFGFSHTVLRVSIFLLAFISSQTLFRLLYTLSGKQAFTAFLFTAALCFNPLYLHLAMTYMTDVFFVSLLIFAMHALVNYSIHGHTRAYLFFCVWIVLALLCRQHAILFSLLIVPGALKHGKTKLQKVVLAILPLLFCWQAGHQYLHYLAEHHIGNGIQQMRDIQGYVLQVPLHIQLLQGADQLLVAAHLALPWSLLLFILNKGFTTKKDWFRFLFCLLLAVLLTVKDLGYYPIGNISDIFEIGPRMLKGSHRPLSEQNDRWFRILTYAMALFSLSLILFVLFFRVKHKAHRLYTSKGFLFFAGVGILYLVFVAMSKAYFDRYVLPLSLLLSILLIPQNSASNSRWKYLLGGLVLLIYLNSVIQNLDYFNWQKTRQKAISYLEAKGVSGQQIDGGFEFNGWIKNKVPYPTKPGLSWWWVMDDKYTVSGRKIEGHVVDTVFVYRRYLPFRNDTVFVLN